MKQIFTLIASSFLSLALFAADAKPKSALSIASMDNANIRVVLDGKKFEPNDNAVILSNLDAGYHNVQVYLVRNNGFIAGTRYEVIFNNTVTTKRKILTTMTIDRNGRVSLKESTLRAVNGGRNNDKDYGYGQSDPSFDYDRDGQFGDYDSHAGYATAMSDYDFRNTLNAIDKEWLESNKLKSALQIVHNNSLSSAQVKQMALLFSFENNKLELAKQAYQNTTDKRNYSLVMDVFSFSSNRAELERFIRTAR